MKNIAQAFPAWSPTAVGVEMPSEKKIPPLERDYSGSEKHVYAICLTDNVYDSRHLTYNKNWDLVIGHFFRYTYPMSFLTSAVSEIVNNLIVILSHTWWIILPVIAAPLFWKAWMFYIQRLYIQNNFKWIVLRVRVSREVLKTPLAMEQVFAAAHGTYSFSIRPYRKYWEGEVEKTTSFEIVGDADGPQFYIRLLNDQRHLIESALYAQYPDAEIEAVDDYVNRFPAILPNDEYDVFGANFILSKDSSYPLRSYKYFESKEEEEKIDTISALMEALSHLQGEQTVWIQIVLRPTGIQTSDWVKRAEAVRDKLIGRKEKEKPTIGAHIGAFIKNFFVALFGSGKKNKEGKDELEWPEAKKEEPKPMLSTLTKGEQAVIEAMDEKTSKLAFETIIRFVYIDRKKTFETASTRGITGWARQFADESLNSLRPDLPTYTALARQPFKKQKIYLKKRRLYDFYKLRQIPKRYAILNIEELATIYHFPSATVKAPGLTRIEAKKGTPPSSLPVQ